MPRVMVSIQIKKKKKKSLGFSIIQTATFTAHFAYCPLDDFAHCLSAESL